MKVALKVVTALSIIFLAVMLMCNANATGNPHVPPANPVSKTNAASAKQKQKQTQKAEANATATVVSDAISESESSSVADATATNGGQSLTTNTRVERSAPAVTTWSTFPTANCRNPYAIGGSVVSGSGLLNWTRVDKDCKINEAITIALEMGNPQLAHKLYCTKKIIIETIGKEACLESYEGFLRGIQKMGENNQRVVPLGEQPATKKDVEQAFKKAISK